LPLGVTKIDANILLTPALASPSRSGSHSSSPVQSTKPTVKNSQKGEPKNSAPKVPERKHASISQIQPQCEPCDPKAPDGYLEEFLPANASNSEPSSDTGKCIRLALKMPTAKKIAVRECAKNPRGIYEPVYWEGQP